MPPQVLEQYVNGGVDSRSNPLNMPTDRFLRCRNWVPLASGDFRARFGYTALEMSTSSAVAIHSMADYHLWNDTAYTLFGQSTALKRRASDGTVTTVGTISSANPWNTFRSKNKIFLGNGVDTKQYDGTTLRDVGIRAPNSTESSSVSVAIGADNSASIVKPSLPSPQGGYQFYFSFYDPNTTQIGNRVLIGSRLLSSSASEYTITGLPDLSGVNPAWQKLIGRSVDGGEVGYAISDASLNWFLVGNTNTTATVTAPYSTVDFDTELPQRNGVPPAMDKFARTDIRIYGNEPNSPYVRWSESEADENNATFAGVAAESWAANSFLAFPTGDVVRGLQSVDQEIWAGSRHAMSILTDYGTYQTWRGTWYGIGFAGQRAFCNTPYGPFWLSGARQLATQGQTGPVAVSDEYEAALLSKIGSAYLSAVEMVYLLDPEKQIDQIVIKARDVNGNPFEIIHDFKLRDDRSPLGQGYERIHTGALASNYTIAQIEDDDFFRRAWAGGADGQLYRLQDGYSDDGEEFECDLIALKNAGPALPEVPQFEVHGDSAVRMSYLGKLNNHGLGDMEPLKLRPRIVNKDATLSGGDQNHEYFANAKKTEQKWVYVRLQLTTHSDDAPATLLNDPPHLPLETYGRVHLTRATVEGQRGAE